MNLSAFGLNCTLKSSPSTSSTQMMLDQVLQAIEAHGASTSSKRVVDHDIKPGVSSDEGNGDEWPMLRKQILDADIFILATPIWMGQPSSVAKRVLERLDALLGESDDHGRYPSFGHVAAVAVVGNEDGAHHVSAELYQGLCDVGFSIPATASSYWVGQAMGSVDYKDLKATPDKVKSVTKILASNSAHLAGLLKSNPYPGA